MELPGGGTLGRITIIYAVLMACTTLACATKYLSPFQLYFSPSHIRKGQVWRIVSHLFYLSNEFSLEFFLYMLFWIPYSNDLENDSFRNRPADFLFFLLFGSTIVTVRCPCSSSVGFPYCPRLPRMHSLSLRPCRFPHPLTL